MIIDCWSNSFKSSIDISVHCGPQTIASSVMNQNFPKVCVTWSTLTCSFYLVLYFVVLPFFSTMFRIVFTLPDQTLGNSKALMVHPNLTEQGFVTKPNL